MAAFLAGFSEKAVYVPVRPAKWAVAEYCTANVVAKVKVAEGQPVAGWCIWYAPGDLIEGEYHCVWKSPTGELIDLTPKPDGERQILFVPDITLGYGMHGFYPNRSTPLSAHGEAVLKQAAEVVKLKRETWEATKGRRDSMLAQICKAAKGVKPKKK